MKRILAGIGRYAVIVPAHDGKQRYGLQKISEGRSGTVVRSVVIGSSGERGIADKVVSSSRGRAMSLAGETDLSELIGLMRRASIVITNDSGPMHIGAALNIPVIAVFGPTSPVLTGPYGRGHVILQTGEPCAPCFKRECADMKCMMGITPGNVIEEAEAALKAAER